MGSTILMGSSPVAVTPSDWPKSTIRRSNQLSRIILGAKNTNHATVTLQEIERRADSGEHIPMLIETRLVHAAVARAVGETAEAEAIVRSALELGAGCGFFQPFVDEAELLASVYHTLGQSGSAAQEVRRLAKRIESDAAPSGLGLDADQDADQASGRLMDDLVEPLSPREIALFACVGRALSNEQPGKQFRRAP